MAFMLTACGQYVILKWVCIIGDPKNNSGIMPRCITPENYLKY